MNFKALILFNYAILCLLFSSCVSNTSITILHPGQITLPKYIDTIGIENRVTLRNIDDPYLSQTKCFYGDNSQFTTDASNVIVKSTFAYLGKSPRFRDVVMPKGSSSIGTSFFPDPLDTLTIQNICLANHVRALMVIESFFCNSEVNTQLSSYQVPHTRGYYVGNVYRTTTYYTTEYNYTAQLYVVYSVGIRMYGKNGSVLDEYRIDRSFGESQDAPTINNAINNLVNRSQVMNLIGNKVADLYTHRISPLWGAESRTYFVNENKHFKAAHDSVLANNWNGAGKSWYIIYLTGKPIKKAEAAYNLALEAEMNEDFPKAVSYLNEALACFRSHSNEYYTSKTIDYLNILKRRQGEIFKLNQQMER
jgi:hypothetical protein